MRVRLEDNLLPCSYLYNTVVGKDKHTAMVLFCIILQAAYCVLALCVFILASSCMFFVFFAACYHCCILFCVFMFWGISIISEIGACFSTQKCIGSLQQIRSCQPLLLDYAKPELCLNSGAATFPISKSPSNAANKRVLNQHLRAGGDRW